MSRTLHAPGKKSRRRAATAPDVKLNSAIDIHAPLPDGHFHLSTAPHSLIEEAAYYRAQKRGFEPGHELDDWLAAEAEIVASETRAPLSIRLSETMTSEQGELS